MGSGSSKKKKTSAAATAKTDKPPAAEVKKDDTVANDALAVTETPAAEEAKSEVTDTPVEKVTPEETKDDSEDVTADAPAEATSTEESKVDAPAETPAAEETKSEVTETPVEEVTPEETKDDTEEKTDAAAADAPAETPAAQEEKGEATDDVSMKLKLAMAHFHGPFQVGGAPKPDTLKKCDELAAKFAAALGSHGQNEDLINLFAEAGTWVDPAPAKVHTGTEELKARIANLPPMDSVELKEVFYCMSPNIFLAKNEVTFTGKDPFVVLDSFEVDDSMQIVKLESFLHAPSAIMGAPKPTGPAEISQKFAQALFTHGQNEDLINLFAADAVWQDPVGGSTYTGTEELTARIEKLPPMESVELKEVFCSMSPKVFLAKTEVTFVGKKPFIVLDKFVCA